MLAIVGKIIKITLVVKYTDKGYIKLVNKDVYKLKHKLDITQLS